jgi:cytochrome b pre-mRNA-processing protein 3
MTFFSALWKSRPEHGAAATVYVAIVAQARQAAFYLNYGVPDTVDGRFDLIILHAMLVMRRLRREGAKGHDIAQALFDYMFSDMDRSLREMGVGDMSIGKHVKKMAKAFYSRAAHCEQGLDGNDDVLTAALASSLFRAKAAGQESLQLMATYLRGADKDLDAVPAVEIEAGRLPWRAP